MKSKTLVTEAMSQGSSGPACSGPFAENHHKRIRVAPSIARFGLENIAAPSEVNQFVCVDGSAKSQVAALSARGGSEFQLASTGGVAKPQV